MDVIFLGVSAVYLGVAIWVYLDATERDSQPVIWGLGVVFLGWTVVPVIIYLAMRRQSQKVEVAPGAGWRQYLYTAGLTGLWLIAAGASSALGVVLYWVAAGGGAMDSGQRYLLASGLAGTVVGATVWQGHWLAAERRLARSASDDQFRAWFSLRRVALLTTVTATVLLTAFASLGILSIGLSDAFGVPWVTVTTWLPAVAPLAVLGAIGAYHVLLLKRTGSGAAAQRFRAIRAPAQMQSGTGPGAASPPTPPSPSPPQIPGRYPTTRSWSFCPACGAAVTLSDAFCRRCGSALTSSAASERRRDQPGAA